MTDRPEQPTPPHLDPSEVVRLDARTLRGIAHPVRLKLLGLLRSDGPSTATRLGERLRLSSAATSYHLRQLAAHGFVVEDPELGQPRERWWRAVHRMTTFDFDTSTAAEADPETAEAGDTYLRSVARLYADAMEAHLDERPQLPAPWRSAGTLSDTLLRLTPEQTNELTDRLWAVVEEYVRADEPGAPDLPGTRRVRVQLAAFAQPGDDE